MGRSPDSAQMMPILLGQKDCTSAGIEGSRSKSPKRGRCLLESGKVCQVVDGGVSPDECGKPQLSGGAPAREGPDSWSIEDEMTEVAEHWRALGVAVAAQGQDGIVDSSLALPEIHAIMKRLATLLEAVTALPDDKHGDDGSSRRPACQVKVRALLSEVARLMRFYQKPIAAAVEAQAAQPAAGLEATADTEDEGESHWVTPVPPPDGCESFSATPFPASECESESHCATPVPIPAEGESEGESHCVTPAPTPADCESCSVTPLPPLDESVSCFVAPLPALVGGRCVAVGTAVVRSRSEIRIRAVPVCRQSSNQVIYHTKWLTPRIPANNAQRSVSLAVPRGPEGQRTPPNFLVRSPSTPLQRSVPNSPFQELHRCISSECVRPLAPAPVGLQRSIEGIASYTPVKGYSDKGSPQYSSRELYGRSHPWILRYAPKELPSLLQKSVLPHGRDAVAQK